MIIGPHASHKTRFSDSSFYDEICENCGATDEVPGGWGKLATPCPYPNGRPASPKEDTSKPESDVL